MTATRITARINHLNSDGFIPPAASVIAEQVTGDGFMAATEGAWVRPIAPPRFMPASGMPYERTVHTMTLKGDDGRAYNVVLDLVRTGKTQALRAAVIDTESGKTVAGCAGAAGTLTAMDAQGRIGFAAKDGSMSFSLKATLAPATLVQGMSDKLKAAVHKQVAEERRAEVLAKLELAVTDYPLTTHTGTVTVGSLKLSAAGTPSSISHQYGQKVSHTFFLASVPKAGAARLTAVVSKVGADAYGYLIRTDASGKAKVALLTPETWKSAFAVKVKTETGAAAFGTVTVTDLKTLMALGLSSAEFFEDVVVDGEV